MSGVQTDRGDGSGRRGQILVVGGLLVAIAFVGLAMVLNGGIYAENVSSRDGPSSVDVVDARQAALAVVNDSVMDANALHDDDHASLAENLTRRTRERKRLLASRLARTGTAVSVTVASIRNRTEIGQASESADLTDATGETNWTLGREVTQLGEFRLHVHADALRGADHPAPFRVSVDTGATRSISVTNNTADDGIRVTIEERDGDTSTCERAGSVVWVNLSAGTVDGTPCTGLADAVEVDSPATVRYHNAEHVRGHYAVTLVSTTGANTTHFTADAGTPTASFAIESVETTFTYQSREVRYDARVTVAGS